MKEVQVGNEILEFPDSMDWKDIQSVMEKEYPVKPQGSAVKEFAKGAVGAVEAGLSTASGLVATPIAGLAGIGAGLISGGDMEKANEAIEKTAGFLTYQPQTEWGEKGTGLVNKGMKLVEKPFEMAGDVVKDVTGSPMLGALTKAGTMIAVPIAGKKAVSVAKQAIKSKVKPVVKAVPAEAPAMETPIAEAPAKTVESLEAEVKGGAIGQTPKYAGQSTSSINLERLSTTDDVKQFINQRATELASKIDKKTVSWEETRAKAEAMGMDVTEALKTSKDVTDLAAKVDATREVHMSMAQSLHDKIKNIPADRTAITPEMKMDILESFNNYAEVLTSTSKMSSEIGRALNIHQRMMAANPDFLKTQSLRQTIKDVLEKGNLDKEFDTIIEDIKGINIKDPKPPKATIADMIFEGWMNTLLSSWKTQLRNIAGNTATIALKTTMETPLTALLELRKGTGRRAFFGEVPAEAVGSWQGVKEGVRAGLKTLITGESPEMLTKVETFHRNAIPGKTGEVIRTPTKLLSAFDEFFKAIAYRGEINKLAYRQAMSEGLRGQARANRMAELLENPTEQLLEKAHADSLYRTFNKPLGNVGQALMKLRDAIPFDIGRYIVPFMRTPTNIAKYTLERTPLSVAKVMRDAKNKKIAGVEISERMARPLAGTMIAAAVWMLVKEGYITGGGPKDKNKREALYRTGWQPYSFRIGGKYTNYNSAEPLGSIFGMTADFAEMFHDKPYIRGDKKMKEMAGQLALSFGKNLTSKTFMQGLSKTLDAISDPQRYGESFLGNYAGTLIPTVAADVARSTDPYYRQMNTPLDAIQSRIPGASQKLFPKRNIWGEPIERGGSSATRLLSPFPVSADKNNKLDSEIVRLEMSVGLPSKKIQGIELTPKEYDDYVRISGEQAKGRLERVVNSIGWNNIPDERKQKIIETAIRNAREIARARILRDISLERKQKSK